MKFQSTTKRRRQKTIKFRWRSLTQPKRINIDGVWMCSDPRIVGRAEARRLYRGRHEEEERKILTETLEAGDVVVELGGGSGLTSIVAARIVGSDKIFVFEANEDAKKIIERNYYLNDVQIEVNYSMVTRKGGDSSFWVSEKLVSSSPVPQDGTCERRMKAVPLCEVLQKYRPNYLICDIEGGEIDLLEHDLSSIDKLMVEFHPHKTSNKEVSCSISSILSRGFNLHSYLAGPNCFYFQRQAVDTVVRD